MNVVKGFQAKEIERWAKDHLTAGSTVVSDGLACFSSVQKVDCTHVSIVTGGGPEYSYSYPLGGFLWIPRQRQQNINFA
jgi:hypothetical protein